MKSKLNYLIGMSLSRKVKTKWFALANIFLALAMIIGLNIDTIINAFGGEFNQKTTIHIIDETAEATQTFQYNMEALYGITEENKDDFKYKIKVSKKSEADLTKKIKDNKEYIIIFKPDDETIMSAKLVSFEKVDALDYQILQAAINNTKVAYAISKSSISPAELARINAPIEIGRHIISDNTNVNENMEVIMGAVFPVIILPVFMLIILLVQMIGAEVNDEKTTRSMEIIISNVSPKTHFFSKVIAGNLFVFIQTGILALAAGAGLLIRNLTGGNDLANGFLNTFLDQMKEAISPELIDKMVILIPLTIILIVLTFIAYSLVAGILASMTTNIEDFQQVQAPIMIVLLVGYYLAIMASLFKGSTFIIGASMLPFISAILAPSLLMIGQISIIHVVFAILLLCLTNFVLIKYGLRIYKVGILNYSSNKLWKKMFKAAKN